MPTTGRSTETAGSKVLRAPACRETRAAAVPVGVVLALRRCHSASTAAGTRSVPACERSRGGIAMRCVSAASGRTGGGRMFIVTYRSSWDARRVGVRVFAIAAPRAVTFTPHGPRTAASRFSWSLLRHYWTWRSQTGRFNRFSTSATQAFPAGGTVGSALSHGENHDLSLQTSRRARMRASASGISERRSSVVDRGEIGALRASAGSAGRARGHRRPRATCLSSPCGC